MSEEHDDALAKSLWDEARNEGPSSSARMRALQATLDAVRGTPDAREERRPSAPPPSVRPIASRSRLPRGAAVGALALAAAFAFVASRWHRTSSQGDVAAHERVELDIGDRARVALDPNAHVRWATAEDVTQDRGAAFYRVDKGRGEFRVHTPAGDVTVVGTCFRVKVHELERSQEGSEDASMNARDIKAGAVGAAATALAFVAVYEGKVSVTHAGQTVSLSAGDAAEMVSGRAPKKAADPAAAERDFDRESAADEATLAANKNLVTSMGEYSARLERLENDKRNLEQQLRDTRDKLAAAQADAGAQKDKTEITEDDWKELAKTGSIKSRVPCNWKGGWTPDPEKLAALGLAPSDAETIRAASNRLYENNWAQIKPVCAQVAGNKEVAERLGLGGCWSFIFNYMKGSGKQEHASALEAMRRVSEMRAGIRPTPTMDDPQVGPVEKMFLVLTGQQKAFEQDLAQSFGPDEAHRIVTSDALCSWQSNWDGPGPRKTP